MPLINNYLILKAHLWLRERLFLYDNSQSLPLKCTLPQNSFEDLNDTQISDCRC